MGSLVGVLKIAAARAGVGIGIYATATVRGRKFCWRCRVFHANAHFVKDSTRGDGLSSSCSSARNTASRAQYVSRPRVSRLGTFTAPTRDGDKRQARARVNHRVDIGLISDPNDLPCTDCGHIFDGKTRHEYDHYKGYGAGQQLKVQAVCSSCHHVREVARG